MVDEALPRNPPLKIRQFRKTRPPPIESTPLPLHVDKCTTTGPPLPPPTQSTPVYVDKSTMTCPPPGHYTDKSTTCPPPDHYTDKTTMTSSCPPTSPPIQSTLRYADKSSMTCLPLSPPTQSHPRLLHVDASPRTRPPLSLLKQTRRLRRTRNIPPIKARPLHVDTSPPIGLVTSPLSDGTSTVSTPSTVQNRKQLAEKSKHIRLWL